MLQLDVTNASHVDAAAAMVLRSLRAWRVPLVGIVHSAGIAPGGQLVRPPEASQSQSDAHARALHPPPTWLLAAASVCAQADFSEAAARRVL
eukprot:1580425-Prymnesium_polylepis.1